MTKRVELDPEGADEAETPTKGATRRAREAEAAAAAMFRRAKQFCQDNRLMRIEIETPSGRLTVYKDPALYLEAFAADEVLLAKRGSRK